MRWPDDVVLRKIAGNAYKSATGLDISDEEIFEYLSHKESTRRDNTD
jgi:hypothetical protein